jgi:RNA polymerase sigma-70 factor, ECF subfamily
VTGPASPTLPTDAAETATDQSLIATINAGDPEAFEALYRRHRDWAVALAHRFTGDADLALDVLQETFLYVLKKFPGFQLNCQFRTFLYPVVRNISLNARRKIVRLRPVDPATLHEVAAPEPSSALATESQLDELASVLAGLPEEHRETLWLRHVDGLALGEIAEILEVPLGTVKSRLHNGVRMLRDDPRTRRFFEP